jgi:hypothetical protein
MIRDKDLILEHEMGSDVRTSKKSFKFSLKTLLLLFIPVALISALISWLLLRPGQLEVTVDVRPYSLARYDDGAGHLPFAVFMGF